MLIKRRLLVIIVLVLTPSAGLAQSIAARVVDSSGAGIPGATVTVISPDGTTRQEVTNAAGEVIFRGLPSVGPYQVNASLAGFATVRETVDMPDPPGPSPFAGVTLMMMDQVPEGEPVALPLPLRPNLQPGNGVEDRTDDEIETLYTPPTLSTTQETLTTVEVVASDTFAFYREVTSQLAEPFDVLAVVPVEFGKSIVIAEEDVESGCAIDLVRVDEELSPESLASHIASTGHPKAIIGAHLVTENAYLIIICHVE